MIMEAGLEVWSHGFVLQGFVGVYRGNQAKGSSSSSDQVQVMP